MENDDQNRGDSDLESRPYDGYSQSFFHYESLPMNPSLSEVISFIREYSGLRKQPIDANSYIEKDLHIAGDDGAELLEEAEKVFGVSFETGDHNLKSLFSMKDNEYLFTSEGFDPFGSFVFLNGYEEFLL